MALSLIHSFLPFYLFHPFILLLLYGTLIVYEGKCHNRTKNKANPARIVRQDSPFHLQNVDFYLFVLERSPLAQGWVQYLLADAQALRSYLQKLIRINEVQGLLQAHDFRRCQLKRLVSTGGTGVGQLLCLADIDFNVLCLRTLAHYHAGIHLDARSDKQGASFLGIEKAVGNGPVSYTQLSAVLLVSSFYSLAFVRHIDSL